jgi:hypothetical protein
LTLSIFSNAILTEELGLAEGADEEANETL